MDVVLDYMATTLVDVPQGLDTTGLIGVMENKMETMEHSKVLRNNLMQQQVEIEKQISVLEGQLQRQKEYLAKIEGGIDVLDELAKPK